MEQNVATNEIVHYFQYLTNEQQAKFAYEIKKQFILNNNEKKINKNNNNNDYFRLMGCLKEYANPALIKDEKDAWTNHLKKKYGDF